MFTCGKLNPHIPTLVIFGGATLGRWFELDRDMKCIPSGDIHDFIRGGKDLSQSACCFTIWCPLPCYDAGRSSPDACTLIMTLPSPVLQRKQISVLPKSPYSCYLVTAIENGLRQLLSRIFSDWSGDKTRKEQVLFLYHELPQSIESTQV